MPYVLLEAPKSSANYDLYEQDGIKIYMSKVIDSNRDVVSLRLKKFLMFKEIIIDGVRVL